MDKRLPPLMPSPATVIHNRHHDKLAFTRQKRRQVASACANCRKRKEKCDDKRPTCGACARRGVTCNNGDKEDETANALALRNRNNVLRQENEQLRELFALLHKLPTEEGHEVISRLKVADDPIQVLRSVQDASLLIRAPNSSPYSALADSRLERLDLLALRESAIRVDAKPWTAVASDGLVSELISSFFNWDDAFYLPFLDREAFLEDMRSGNPTTAKYCTPFLVNAICAARCCTCRRTKAFSGIGKLDLASDFLNEAKKLLDLENGRASVTTVQGLTLLFSVSAYMGSDRAGMVYREWAYDMFFKLDVEAMYEKIKDDPTKARDRRILSRLAWGLFLFESIVGYCYLAISMIPPPKIPRCFEPPPSVNDGPVPNVDSFGNPHTSESKSPPFVTGALWAACDVTEMLYRSMEWNLQAAHICGTEADVEERKNKIEKLRRWRANLHPSLRDDTNFTPQTGYLRAYMNEVLISILRPLDHQTEIEPGWTVKALCLNFCEIDIDNMERFVKVYTLRDYACINICGAFNAILILVYHLADPAVHPMFTKAARLIRQTGGDFPMSRFILQTLKAVTWSNKLPMPPLAKPYFENLGSDKSDLRDPPLSFALPDNSPAKKLLTIGPVPARPRETDSNFGSLLSKWSALSIDY